MTPDELISNYPVLHHMAEQDSWPRIRQLGLRTTEQLVDACDLDAELRAEILTRRRKVSYELRHPVVGTITIRDQKPLMLHNLEPALSDLTVGEFLAILNNRVFMWTHPSRLTRLLSANAYRDSVHEVLVIDTALLVETYADSIRLTGMNTGATIFPNSPTRGAESFMPLSDFPFQARQKGRTLPNNVVELCVIGGVDNVQDYVLRVERRQGADVVETIYKR